MRRGVVQSMLAVAIAAAAGGWVTAAWSARQSPNPPGRRRANGEPGQQQAIGPIQNVLDKLADKPPHHLGDLDHRD